MPATKKRRQGRDHADRLFELHAGPWSWRQLLPRGSTHARTQARKAQHQSVGHSAGCHRLSAWLPPASHTSLTASCETSWRGARSRCLHAMRVFRTFQPRFYRVATILLPCFYRISTAFLQCFYRLSTVFLPRSILLPLQKASCPLVCACCRVWVWHIDGLERPGVWVGGRAFPSFVQPSVDRGCADQARQRLLRSVKGWRSRRRRCCSKQAFLQAKLHLPLVPHGSPRVK